MTITLKIIQTLAPDQSSLNAAKKLLKPAKWPVKQQLESKELVWGHCQGSGSKPYYTVFDTGNHGYKCTCPSRKFPCKHVLALMWQYADDEAAFGVADVPQWVSDWLGRRRSKSTSNVTEKADDGKKAHNDLSKTIATAEDTGEISATDGKKQAAAAKRAEKLKVATDKAISAGLKEYEQWLNDQLRTGLIHFLDHAGERCRSIAARLVDAKATTLAARLDELPAKLMHIPKDNQLRVVTNELGKIICLAKAWQANPEDKDVRRAISSAENRDSVLEASDTIWQQGIWQVVAEQVESRRDGLVSHATWLRYVGVLLNDDPNKPQLTLTQPQDNQQRAIPALPFALLQDYYPASNAGRRGTQTGLGSYLFAKIAYYSSHYPLRAIIATQQTLDNEMAAAVATVVGESRLKLDWHSNQRHNHLPNSLLNFYQGYQQALAKQPWLEAMPCWLPNGYIRPMLAEHSAKSHQNNHKTLWWQADTASENHLQWQLPLRPKQHQNQRSLDYVLACPLAHSFMLWDGVYATFGSGYHPDWGQVSW